MLSSRAATKLRKLIVLAALGSKVPAGEAGFTQAHAAESHKIPVSEAQPQQLSPVSALGVADETLQRIPPHQTSRVRDTRRLASSLVQPGSGTLQAAFAAAAPGNELVLADGIYTGADERGDAYTLGGDQLLLIDKDVTIRAQNPGRATLDAQGSPSTSRRVLYIGHAPWYSTGTMSATDPPPVVTLVGLVLTGGYSSLSVCSALFESHSLPLAIQNTSFLTHALRSHLTWYIIMHAGRWR